MNNQQSVSSFIRIVSVFFILLTCIGISPLNNLLQQTAVAAAPTNGLKAYWKLDETGATTNVSDSSSFGNTGSVKNGAIWTLGKLNNGLNFDGVNDYVLFPNSTSLNISGKALTLSLWANIPNATSDKVLLGKMWGTSGFNAPYYQYAIEYSGTTKKVSFYFGNTSSTLVGPFSMTVPYNVWTNISFTYDGVNVRGYVDGVQQFATAQTTSIASRSGVLRLGTDNKSNQALKGKLDEVRIYNRALTAQEITSIFTDVVSAPDTTAPSVPTGLAASAVSSTQINLTWTASTDNVGVTGYRVFRNGTQIATTTATSFSNTGLTASTSYTYNVSAYDLAGNVSALSATVNTTTPAAPDTTAPVLNAGNPQGILPSNITNATLSLMTNESATCRYANTPNLAYSTMVSTLTTTGGINHSTILQNLLEGNSYSYYVRCIDTAGNTNSSDYTISFSIASQQTGSTTSYLNFQKVIVDNTSPNDPWMKNIADLDNDSLPDLIVSGAYGPIVWYQAPNWTKRTITNSSISKSGSTPSDIDGDGDIDFVNGGYWYENSQGGMVWTPHQFENTDLISHDILTYDMNSDGKTDIITRGEYDTIVHIFLQNTPTSWTEIQINPGRGFNGLAVGDINADGRPDIVVSGVWMESPTGSIIANPWIPHTFTTSWHEFAAIHLSDIDNDGRIDIVMSVSEDIGGISWFKAPIDPKTGPWIETSVATNLNKIHNFEVVDVDDDGITDIVASEFEGSGRLFVYLRKGAAWEANLIGTDSIHNVRVGDIDNDGDMDFFGTDAWGEIPVIVYRNLRNIGTLPYKVLVFSKTLGFRHDSIPVGIAAIEALGPTNNFTVTSTEDSSVFTDANLSQYKVIVFLNPSGEILDISQQNAFKKFIQNGGGFVGIHNATAYVLENWPWYDQLISTRFDTEMDDQDLHLQVLNHTHASTRNLPNDWTFFEEAYNWTVNPKQNGATVLVNLDESTVYGGTMGADHPFTWYKKYDGGKSWYTMGGANAYEYSLPLFMDHILGGIQYAAGATVNLSNQNPIVSLTSPLNGSTYTSFATITLSANASDTDGTISKVDFLKNGVVIGTSTVSPYMFTATGISTGSYTFTARAIDNRGGISISQPITVTVIPSSDITPPSIPSAVTANAISGNSIKLSWTLSTDNVGVQGYNIFRNTVQVGTSQTGSFIDSNLSPVTSYSYRVSAVDTAGNESGLSNTITGTTASGSPIAFVQSNSMANDSGGASASINFTGANTAGNMIVLAISWGDYDASSLSATDSAGNTYQIASRAFDSVQNQGLAILYASNIKANANNTVTVSFGGSKSYHRLSIHEYKGIAITSPLDVTATNISQGTSSVNGITSSTGITTQAGNLIFGVTMNDDGAGIVNILPGTGFIQRTYCPTLDLLSEDTIQETMGGIAATFTFAQGRRYLSQMAAFKQIGN